MFNSIYSIQYKISKIYLYFVNFKQNPIRLFKDIFVETSRGVGIRLATGRIQIERTEKKYNYRYFPCLGTVFGS